MHQLTHGEGVDLPAGLGIAIVAMALILKVISRLLQGAQGGHR